MRATRNKVYFYEPHFAACWKDFDPAILHAFNDVYKHDIEGFGYKLIHPNPESSGSSFSHHHKSDTKTFGDIAVALGLELQHYTGPGCF